MGFEHHKDTSSVVEDIEWLCRNKHYVAVSDSAELYAAVYKVLKGMTDIMLANTSVFDNDRTLAEMLYNEPINARHAAINDSSEGAQIRMEMQNIADIANRMYSGKDADAVYASGTDSQCEIAKVFMRHMYCHTKAILFGDGDSSLVYDDKDDDIKLNHMFQLIRFYMNSSKIGLPLLGRAFLYPLVAMKPHELKAMTLPHAVLDYFKQLARQPITDSCANEFEEEYDEIAGSLNLPIPSDKRGTWKWQGYKKSYEMLRSYLCDQFPKGAFKKFKPYLPLPNSIVKAYPLIHKILHELPVFMRFAGRYPYPNLVEAEILEDRIRAIFSRCAVLADRSEAKQLYEALRVEFGFTELGKSMTQMEICSHMRFSVFMYALDVRSDLDRLIAKVNATVNTIVAARSDASQRKSAIKEYLLSTKGVYSDDVRENINNIGPFYKEKKSGELFMVSPHTGNTIKKCTRQQIRNPYTGRCIKIGGPTFNLLWR